MRGMTFSIAGISSGCATSIRMLIFRKLGLLRPVLFRLTTMSGTLKNTSAGAAAPPCPSPFASGLACFSSDAWLIEGLNTPVRSAKAAAEIARSGALSSLVWLIAWIPISLDQHFAEQDILDLHRLRRNAQAQQKFLAQPVDAG